MYHAPTIYRVIYSWALRPALHLCTYSVLPLCLQFFLHLNLNLLLLLFHSRFHSKAPFYHRSVVILLTCPNQTSCFLSTSSFVSFPAVTFQCHSVAKKSISVDNNFLLFTSLIFNSAPYNIKFSTINLHIIFFCRLSNIFRPEFRVQY